MEKEFVPYELALRMKQLGFDKPCFNFYMGGFKVLAKVKLVFPNNIHDSNVLAPTFSQAFRFFREKYNLDSYVMPSPLETKKVYDYYIWFINEEDERDLFIGMNNQYSYEEAELACLEKLLEIVEQKEKI